MFFEETAHAFRGHRQRLLRPQSGRNLLETQRGIFDVFDQYQNGRLRAQRRRRVRRCRDHRRLALLPVKGRLDREVSKLALNLEAIKFPILVQMGQDGRAGVL